MRVISAPRMNDHQLALEIRAIVPGVARGDKAHGTGGAYAREPANPYVLCEPWEPRRRCERGRDHHRGLCAFFGSASAFVSAYS